jgi:hypothetical protein
MDEFQRKIIQSHGLNEIGEMVDLEFVQHATHNEAFFPSSIATKDTATLHIQRTSMNGKHFRKRTILLMKSKFFGMCNCQLLVLFLPQQLIRYQTRIDVYRY